MNQLEEVVKFTLYKCRETNNPVTENLASFVAQTILNSKTNRFYLEDKINESELKELKAETLKKLVNLKTLPMKTISMQITYDSLIYENEVNRNDESKKNSLETGKLIDEVVTLEIKNAKDFEGLTNLYKKIYNFLIFKNNELTLGDKINSSLAQDNTAIQFNMEKEVAAALESVIPRAALGPFVSLNPSEKVTQLVELSNLVIGIRLFNKEIGKGGQSLLNFTILVDGKTSELLDQIKKEAVETFELCEQYSLVFLSRHNQINGLTKSDLDRFREELTFLRQYLAYIISMQEDVEVSLSQIETNSSRYQKEISDLRNLLGNKSSAPKEQVYPKFAILAQSYQALLEEKKLNKTRLNLFTSLKEFRNNVQTTMNQNILRLAQGLVEEENNECNIKYQSDSGVLRLLPSNTPDFMQTPLDFLGFCISHIANKDGLLIPGKPVLGVFKFRDKNCVFYDEKAALWFIQDPTQALLKVVDQCRRHPELIHLLRMEDSFRGLQLSGPVQGKEGLQSNKLMVDKGSETPTHFISKNIDPNYCWNEWELRRKAIQMADIRKKQTKACQTILSHFKVDSEAQVYEKREKGTSTGVNAGVNPLRPRNYMVGLRDKNTN